MLSGLLLSYVRMRYGASLPITDAEVDGEIEDASLNLATDKLGKLITMHQVHHYLYRAESLSHLNSHDSCQNVSLEKKSRSEKNMNTHETRLGVLHRHTLNKEHELHDTHVLLEHTNIMRGKNCCCLIPRVIGMCIPCKQDETAWALFTLAHFKPFSMTDPLLQPDEDCLDVYSTYEFDSFSKQVMENWESVHECEDA